MPVEPYLMYDGRTEEAIEFYKRAVGATVNMLLRVKDAPEKGPMHGPGMDNKIMHASLNIGGTQVMMSDGGCTGNAKFDGITLSLSTANVAEADKFFAGLSEGGTVTMPQGETFFSPRFGMCRDKFGVHWMVIVPKAM